MYKVLVKKLLKKNLSLLPLERFFLPETFLNEK